MNSITMHEVEHIIFAYTQSKLSFDEPIPDFSTRFPNKLESCLATPFQAYADKDLYPSLTDKAAMLFYLMIKNHPFQNGNKRIALMTLLYYLNKHEKGIDVEIKTMYQWAIAVASSPAPAKAEIFSYIKKFLEIYMVPLRKNKDR